MFSGLDGYKKVPVAIIDGVLVKGAFSAYCHNFTQCFAPALTNEIVALFHPLSPHE
jgi:hypothetical protein